MHLKSEKIKKPYWSYRDLVLIATFTALIKITSFLVSITGGGMNPLALIFKNIVSTALVVVLVFSVRKFGTLTLYVMISALISALAFGHGMILLPSLLIAGLIGDALIFLLGGHTKNYAVIMGVALFETLFRAFSLGFNAILIREDRNMFIMAAIIVAIGYIGCLIGLKVGVSFSKELRHAGIIKE